MRSTKSPNLELCTERTSSTLFVHSGMWKYRIGLASFCFSRETPVWSLPHKNEGISRREEFVPMENTSTKHKYVVNQKLEHVDYISFREFFGRIRVGFFFTKKDLSIPSTRYLYLRWPFFFMKQSWTNYLNLSFRLEWGIFV